MLRDILDRLDEGIRTGQIKTDCIIDYESLPKQTKRVLDAINEYFEKKYQHITAETLAEMLHIEKSTAGGYLETLALNGHLIRIIERTAGKRYYMYRPVINN